MTATVFLTFIIGIAVALSAIMAGAWLVWRRTGNSGWVDTIWTFALGLVGIGSSLVAGLAGYGTWSRRALVIALIAGWALRLGLHIAQRTRGVADDPRYARFIKEWGADARRKMFQFLQLQALVSIPLVLSMLLAASNPVPMLRIQDLLGALILLAGIAGEGLADGQLRRFRANPANKGRICDIGLWSWSRHPNYFFEWLGWIAYAVIAIDVTGFYPWGWIAISGPACMYWLLVHASGIPPLEQHMLKRRGAAFAAYQKRTSAFFPLPPKFTGQNS